MNGTSSLSSSFANAFTVKVVVCILRLTLTILEPCIWFPTKLLKFFSSFRQLARPQDSRKTVVVVGGNFSGLAAIWELLHHVAIFQVILVDQREYFEFTPGILRLFCDPDHFLNIANILPHANHQVIQGKVVSVVEEADSTGNPKKILTYERANSVTGPASSLSTPPQRVQLKYDYLILATGATYVSPISPVSSEAKTLQGRFQEWKAAYGRLLGARRILILGGGPVGVELAAEIVDYYSTKQVTLLDAQVSLLGNFPKAVADYAQRWLRKRGVNLKLGSKLQSWNETSCTLEDGTVLQADVVYVCFGNKPNSEALSKAKQAFSLDGRRNVKVDATLQVQGGPIQDGSIFACGDVAGPQFGSEKQALQAEIQGQVAAWNVVMSEKGQGSASTTLYRYPHDISGSNRMPLVFVLSLGRYDGVLGFNGLCITGSFAAIAKWLLEYTKVIHMQGRIWGKLIWKIGDAVVLFLSRTLVKPTNPKKLE